MKQLKSKKSSGPPPQGNYSQTNCQLTSLPTKLYAFSGLVALDLSFNRIADLSQLLINPKSQQSLSRLRYLNLSYNSFPNVDSLKPLAQVSKDLQRLDIRENPLTRTLNYLYELAFMFQKVIVMSNKITLSIDEALRKAIFEFHQAGNLIDQFLSILLQPLNSKEQLLEQIQNIVEALKELENLDCLIDKNQSMFEVVSNFIKIVNEPHHSLKVQHINTVEEYQVLFSPIYPQSHKTIVKKKSLPIFYYRYMTQSPSIQSKLLQDYEVDEQTHDKIEQREETAFVDTSLLIPELISKWHEHQKKSVQRFRHLYENMTTGRDNILVQQSSSKKLFSPFRSIQTGAGTQRQLLNSRFAQPSICYFGFDPDWCQKTRTFIIHRLLSFLKHSLSSMSFAKSEGIPENDENNTYNVNISDWQLHLHPGDSYEKKEIMSPKSRNKFILSSSLSVLEATMKKIAFRKIRQTNLIKYSHILLFQEIQAGIKVRLERLAFRKISQAAFHYQCVLSKLRLLKLGRMFKGWMQVRKRKLKLLRTLTKRKCKKEAAFLSVAITQWRITARHLATYTRLKHHSGSLSNKEKSSALVYESLERSTSRKIVNNLLSKYASKSQFNNQIPSKVKIYR